MPGCRFCTGHSCNLTMLLAVDVSFLQLEGHTYERTDREGTFHTLWDDTHKDIGDLAGRTAGEV